MSEDLIHPHLWHGDGNWSQIIAMFRKQDISGVNGWQFRLRPSEFVKSEFNLEGRKMLDPQYGLINRWYPECCVHVLSRHPHRGRIICTLDFMGNETPLSRQVIELTAQIQDLEKELKITKGGLAVAREDQMEAMTQQRAIVDKWVDIIKTARKAGGNIPPEMAAAMGMGGENPEDQ